MAANERTFINDTAIIDSFLYHEDGGEGSPTAVAWEFVNPDKQDIIVATLPASPATGRRVLVNNGAQGFPAWAVVEWNGTAWTQIAQAATPTLTGNHAVLGIPGELITKPGIYMGLSRWTENGVQKTTTVQFEAIDPLEREGTTPLGEALDMAWMRLEDLFDSELGGPHMRDRTLRSFNKEKLAKFVPGALYTINHTYQPDTGYNDENFPYDAHAPLLSQGLLLEGIRHLMRTYVEQPQPVGSNVTYFDRRDYLQRWNQIYDVEEKLWLQWIDLFKKDLMGFGNTSILLGGYSGFYGRHPRFMRSGYPYISRYW
jgi:hypothetical protein